MGNRRESPSFSSTLLDSIYHSIDESSNGTKRNEDLMKKKQSNHSHSKILITRKSRVEFDDPMLLNSSSTNSDSSSGGGFSSSESDSFYSSKSRPKPIRTSVKHEVIENNFHGGTDSTTQKLKQSKALKIYSELKKVKQPISPGAKLSSFINSLFNTKKTRKINSSSSKYEGKASSTCSSASSFSRSCLSMTKSTTRNVGGGTKRSVKFCLDDVEDSRPCGQIKIHHENELQASMRKLPVKVEENRGVAEAAKELLNSYRKKKKEPTTVVSVALATDDDDDDYDDDVASYASSDLFELDNFKAIGDGRYLEELPVYETTHFDTNRAISYGLIL